MVIRVSFISNLINKFDDDLYDRMFVVAQLTIAIGICVISLIYGLSLFFDLKIISRLLWWVSDFNILTIWFVICLIRILDITVEIELDETVENDYSYKKSAAYRWTVVWGIVMLFLGATALYFSGKYYDSYAFRTETFLVDVENKQYHIIDNERCEDAEQTKQLIKMKGADIDSTYELCIECEEWLEEIDFMADDAYVHP